MAPASRPTSPYGNDSRRTTETDCSDARSPTDTNRAVSVDRGLVRADRLDPDVVAGRDFERHAARHDLQRLADFGRDGIADLRGVRDVVEVSAAGVGELLEEPLIEVVADAERRCRDASRPQFGGVRGEHGRVGLADIGKTVCQEQAPIDAVLELVTGQLLAAAKPPFGQVRAAPGVDRAQAIDGGAPRLGRRVRRFDDRLDDVVVDDRR